MADVGSTAPIDGRLQALLLSRPIEVWTSDDATSGRAYTEQGPRPGLPVANQASHAVLQVSGTTNGTAAYEVRCQHGGLPGQVDHGMAVAVRRAGEAYHLGHRPASILTGWEPLWYSLQDYVEPSIAAHPDGVVVHVARKGRELFAKVRMANGTIGAEVTVHADDKRPVYWPSVGFVGAECYVIAWRRGLEDQSGFERYYLAVWRSTDNGATWAMAQDYATDEDDVIAPAVPPTSTGGSLHAGRIRWAYRDGEVVVFAHVTRLAAKCDSLRQYAGASLLGRLDIVETAQSSAGSAGWAVPDVVATPTGFLVAALGPVPTTGGGTEVWSRTIGSAWQPVSTAIASDRFPAFGVSGTALGGGQVLFAAPVALALAWDPVGIGWVYVVENDGTVGGVGSGWSAYTTDGGVSWRRGNSTPNVYAPSGAWYMSYDHGGSSTQGSYPKDIGAAWYRGRALLVHTFESDSTAYDSSPCLAYLGGWHDLTMPWEGDGVRLGHVAGWRRVWLPFNVPSGQDFTTTTSGTNSEALVTGDGDLELSTGDGAGTAGEVWFQHAGSAFSGPMDASAEWELRMEAGAGSVSATWVGVRLRVATATHGVEIEVNLASTQVGVRDTVSGAALAGSPFAGFVSGTWYRFALSICMDGDTGSGRNAQLWYRSADNADGQRWTLLGSWTLTDDNGAGGVVPHIEFGHIVASGALATQTSRWRSVQWAIPEGANALARHGTEAKWCVLDRSADYPALVFGRPLGTAQDWSVDGLLLAGRRGPGLVGDSWTIPVSGDHEIGRAITLDTPTPRIHHRTVDNASQVVIPWAADAERPNVEDSEHPPMMALRIWCNWRTAYLEYLPQGGAWTQAAVIDTAVLQGASYTRAGRTIRSASTGSTVYLHRHEVGPDWTAQWDNGAGTTVYRHLVGNIPGRWSSSTSEPRARLELDATKAGDPTSGGTLSLWSPEIVVLAPGVNATAWRLRIPAQGTADGDLRTKLAWCDVHVLAQLPSWTRGYTSVPGHDRVALEGGVGVRVSRSPASQELRIAWDEGIDETDIGQPGEVRYVMPYSSGSEPASSLGEIPRSLVGMLDQQAGRPVGWCVWERTASGAVVLRRRYEQLWGTVEAAPDREIVLGDAGQTEVVRVSTLTIREER